VFFWLDGLASVIDQLPCVAPPHLSFRLYAHSEPRSLLLICFNALALPPAAQWRGSQHTPPPDPPSPVPKLPPPAWETPHRQTAHHLVHHSSKTYISPFRLHQDQHRHIRRRLRTSSSASRPDHCAIHPLSHNPSIALAVSHLSPADGPPAQPIRRMPSRQLHDAVSPDPSRVTKEHPLGGILIASNRTRGAASHFVSTPNFLGKYPALSEPQTASKPLIPIPTRAS
jgi:hypothetical protein